MIEARSLIERIARLKPEDRAAIIGGMSDADIELFGETWCIWAQPAQLPPPLFWEVWLIMAGRGFGKTRAGAEWVHHRARSGRKRIALVAATEDEARRVMVEGASGVLACAPAAERPVWEPSRGTVTWGNGSQAFVYSGAKADGLRGPEHDYAWCDEIAKWAQPDAAFDNLRMGLRRGRSPQLVVTTTPKPVPIVRRVLGLKGVVVTRGRTRDNLHLSDDYVNGMESSYAGTRVGRQELDGELIEDVAGALWTRARIEASRFDGIVAMRRVVIGVDPPASAGGDACGIVCVALGEDGFCYVLEDASLSGASPEGWAAAVAELASRRMADRVVAEANNGGDMVASVLRAADTGLPVTLVHASRGKVARAEPVALLYERGKVFHAGVFARLEDELCGLTMAGGYEGPGRSPDRADALVWAVSELMLGARAPVPQIRVL